MFTIPKLPTLTTTPTQLTNQLITKLRQLRKPKLPMHQALHLLNLELQEKIMNTHSAHVSQARYYQLSQTYNMPFNMPF
jgi:hypothetical protein